MSIPNDFITSILAHTSIPELDRIHNNKLHPLNVFLDQNTFLCQISGEYELTTPLSFKEFLSEFNKVYLFKFRSRCSCAGECLGCNSDDEYRFKYYRQNYTTAKALRHAALNNCTDFIDLIIDRYHLQVSSLHLTEICKGFYKQAELMEKYLPADRNKMTYVFDYASVITVITVITAALICF